MMPTALIWMPEWQSEKSTGFRPCVSVAYEPGHVLVAPCSTAWQAKGTAIHINERQAQQAGMHRKCSVVMTELRWLPVKEFGKWMGYVPATVEKQIIEYLKVHTECIPYA